MWSLFKKKGDSGIFQFSGEALNPIIFSNGKSQADIVKEIIDLINQGNKIVFIRGVCGTGKSAIALNLARHFKKTAIVVPIKSLQEQYENDYTNNKFILKKDSKQLKISVIKGRNNFSCPFSGESADSQFLPCTIELREKNLEQLKRFIDDNPKVSKYDFTSIKDIKRMSVAPACPYWSPLLPSDLNSKALEGSGKKKYNSVSGKEYCLYCRKPGCKYYEQYNAYSDSDVLIFNSLKYIIESSMGRKPKTDLDIIDECDEFLDNFANEKRINLTRLMFSLSDLNPIENREDFKKIIFLLTEILEHPGDSVQKISKDEIISLVDLILENPHLAEEDEENYYNRVVEILREFEHLLNEAYVSYSKESGDRETVYANIVTINLADKFKELIEQNNALVLMSGTLHSEKVLKDIFGLEKFKIIDAETRPPGTISKIRTGMEKNCKFENFKSGLVTRKDYLLALSACVKNAKPPILVHVNSFDDLPSQLEKMQYNLGNLITKEKLLELQKTPAQINKFKSGEIDILFTTKCSRGVDFPGEQCNSIIITRYPYPNIKSLFWQILKKEKPEKFSEFYMDKARRELLQKIYRGLRFKEDHVILLSPDVRVLNDSLS